MLGGGLPEARKAALSLALLTLTSADSLQTSSSELAHGSVLGFCALPSQRLFSLPSSLVCAAQQEAPGAVDVWESVRLRPRKNRSVQSIVPGYREAGGLDADDLRKKWVEHSAAKAALGEEDIVAKADPTIEIKDRIVAQVCEQLPSDFPTLARVLAPVGLVTKRVLNPSPQERGPETRCPRQVLQHGRVIDIPERSELERMPVLALKELCLDWGLMQKGNKQMIVERLAQARGTHMTEKQTMRLRRRLLRDQLEAGLSNNFHTGGPRADRNPPF